MELLRDFQKGTIDFKFLCAPIVADGKGGRGTHKDNSFRFARQR